MSRLPFYSLVFLLITVGLAMTLHRHYQYEVPWLPGEQRTVWEIQAQITLEAQGDPVQVELVLPASQRGFRVLSEYTASSGYGLAFNETPQRRTANWEIRTASGPQQLYYTVQMLVAPGEPDPPAYPPSTEQELFWEPPFDIAARDLVSRALMRSATNLGVVRELVLMISGPAQDENARLLLTQYDRTGLLVRLLQQADIPARSVSGLLLENGRRRQPLVTWLQVYAEGQWVLVNPASGEVGKPDNLLIWRTSSGPSLTVLGGVNSQVTFSMLRHARSTAISLENQFAPDTFLNFSIHSLPLEEQALFMTILLIPIGALIVVVLRILVGIRTSGTFMPVLIALAFIQTTLLTGLVGFLLVVAVGLMIRSYLSRLNLLLVARVSAVIITVIGIISIFSVLSYRLGLNAGLTITFFPMIILSWTIERMSILWEEEGPYEVLVQGSGSLLTAVIAYLAMTNPWVRHITFNFLGVQLILMALILMIGNYKGYRLLELRRFKTFAREKG